MTVSPLCDALFHAESCCAEPFYDELASAESLGSDKPMRWSGRWRRWAGLLVCLGSGSIALMAAEPAIAHQQGTLPLPTTTALAPLTLNVPLLYAQSGAVSISSVEDAIAKFTTSRQLYIKGTPLTPEQISRLLVTLNANPNVFVVVLERSDNVVADDETLSRGMGNSAAFEQIVHPVTGERQGVLFMVYFDSNEGRKIFMRSEALPDRLGVGEKNFATATGEPRTLLNVFRAAIQSEGKDMPGALEVVINRINGTIQQHVEGLVSSAQTSVHQASVELASVSDALAMLTAQGVGGAVSNLDEAGLQNQLRQAQTALANTQYAQAQTLSQGVLDAVQAHSTLLDQYRQAPEIAAQLQADLNDVAIALDTLPGPYTTTLLPALSVAQQSLQTYARQHQAGQPEFWSSLQTAQAQVAALDRDIRAATRAITRRQLAQGGVGLLGFALILGLWLQRWFAAKTARLKAEATIQAAETTIAERTRSLLALMDDAEHYSFKAYTGATAQQAHTLLEHLTNALVLVAGAEQAIGQAQQLARANAMINRLSTRNHHHAVALLTDSNTALSLDAESGIQALLGHPTRPMTDPWRSYLSTQTATPLTAVSFQTLLDTMATHRTKAMEQLKELKHKSSDIAAYLSQIETDAMAVQQRVQAWPDLAQGNSKTAQWFTLSVILRDVMPRLLGAEGHVTKGRQLMDADPMTAWERYGDESARIVAELKMGIALAERGRTKLLVILDQADGVLQAHHIQTDWAYTAVDHLSQRLDQTVQATVHDSVVESFRQLETQMQQLGDRIQTIVRQDETRRTVAAHQIQLAKTTAIQAQRQVYQQLQTLPLERSSPLEDVLQESGYTPSVPITAAYQCWVQLKTHLEQGDDAQVQAGLDAIATHTQTAQQWIAQTLAAVEVYPQRLSQLKRRILAVRQQGQRTAIPLLQAIKQQYAPDVLARVAPDVGAGKTIADNVKIASNLVTTATTTLHEAVATMGQAGVLHAEAALDKTERLANSAQTQLDAIATAQEFLAQKQQQAMATAVALREEWQQTRSQLSAPYVRSQTQALDPPLQQQMAQVLTAVHQTPQHPYEAADAVATAEATHQQLADAIAADQNDFNAATDTIAQAQSAIDQGQSDLRTAKFQRFRYATVYTGEVQAQLRNARASLTQAKRSLESQQYQASIDHGYRAIQQAQQASQTAENEIAIARQAHNRERSRRAHARTSSSSNYTSYSSSSSSSPSPSPSFSSSPSPSSSSSSSGSRGGSW